jgi:hypothetical protein
MVGAISLHLHMSSRCRKFYTLSPVHVRSCIVACVKSSLQAIASGNSSAEISGVEPRVTAVTFYCRRRRLQQDEVRLLGLRASARDDDLSRGGCTQRERGTSGRCTVATKS